MFKAFKDKLVSIGKDLADALRILRIWRILSRIIYIRFCSKSAVLLPRIKNQNIEAENKKLIVETLGHLQYKQEVFTEVAF